MKDKSFLAINLNDFHSNQSGSETVTQIKFIAASSLDNAISHINSLYPDKAWVVIPKTYFDEHIVYRTA